MRNLHFVLIKANTAKKAMIAVHKEAPRWDGPPIDGMCGAISAFSEDGSDDFIIEDFPNSRYKASATLMSHLDKYVSAGETHFSKAAAYIRDTINKPISFELSPRSQHPTVRSALDKIIGELNDFDPEQNSSSDLIDLACNLMDITGYVDSRKALKAGVDVPELWSRQLRKLGLTDWTKRSKGQKRYIVVLDVYSEDSGEGSSGVYAGYYHERS